MKKMVPGFLIGIVTGVVITFLVVFFASPSLMIHEDKSTYDFSTTVTELEKSAAEAGWKIPNVNDLQATLHKFGKDVRQVKVLSLCHPEHAYRVLSQDDERIVSSLMPCRVAVYEKSDGSVHVSRLNSGLMSRPMSKVIRQTMSDAAVETEEILQAVIE